MRFRCLSRSRSTLAAMAALIGELYGFKAWYNKKITDGCIIRTAANILLEEETITEGGEV